MSKWSSAFRDSRWQKKRLEIMERDGWTCQSCGASGEGVTLNVHHVYYEAGKAPWDYSDDMLYTWCEGCHTAIHALQHMLHKRVCAFGIPILLLNRLIGYSDATASRPCLDCGGEYERGYADGAAERRSL